MRDGVANAAANREADIQENKLVLFFSQTDLPFLARFCWVLLLKEKLTSLYIFFKKKHLPFRHSFKTSSMSTYNSSKICLENSEQESHTLVFAISVYLAMLCNMGLKSPMPVQWVSLITCKISKENEAAIPCTLFLLGIGLTECRGLIC